MTRCCCGSARSTRTSRCGPGRGASQQGVVGGAAGARADADLRHGDDSRSQHENKRLALKRLRMNIAMRLRGSVDLAAPPPAFVRECMFSRRGLPRRSSPRTPGMEEPGFARGHAAPRQSSSAESGERRLEIGTKDFRFWRIAAWLLDVLESCSGRAVSDAAAIAGITTGNFSDLLTSDRHLLAAAQEIRKRHNLKPLI